MICGLAIIVTFLSYSTYNVIHRLLRFQMRFVVAYCCAALNNTSSDTVSRGSSAINDFPVIICTWCVECRLTVPVVRWCN